MRNVDWWLTIALLCVFALLWEMSYGDNRARERMYVDNREWIIIISLRHQSCCCCASDLAGSGIFVCGWSWCHRGGAGIRGRPRNILNLHFRKNEWGRLIDFDDWWLIDWVTMINVTNKVRGVSDRWNSPSVLFLSFHSFFLGGWLMLLSIHRRIVVATKETSLWQILGVL